MTTLCNCLLFRDTSDVEVGETGSKGTLYDA